MHLSDSSEQAMRQIPPIRLDNEMTIYLFEILKKLNKGVRPILEVTPKNTQYVSNCCTYDAASTYARAGPMTCLRLKLVTCNFCFVGKLYARWAKLRT